LSLFIKDIVDTIIAKRIILKGEKKDLFFFRYFIQMKKKIECP